jgi:TPR repeat protein
VIGEKDAQYFIGWCYFRGEGVKHNASEAKYWLEKASNQGDYRASGILSTLKYKESSDWDVILLTRAAEQGDPHSCFQIATESWISPKGEEKFNSFSGIKPEAAYNFIKKAADKHFSPSYEILGLFYLEGYGITQDTTKAIDIMETGAMGGCKVCSRLLGFIYDLETYGCRNLEKSAEWYELGATQGDNESQAIFAQKLKNGDGCIKNIKESYKWLLICKKNIHTFKVDTQKEILDSINELETILSSASIEDIQKTASEITNEKENSEEFEYLIPTPPIEPKFSQYHFLVFAIISLILPVIINIFKV